MRPSGAPAVPGNEALLFCAVPALFYLFPHLFLLTGGYDRWIMPDPRELGYVENATALLFLFGGCYAFYLSRQRADDVPLYRPTLVLAGLLGIWVCLEEVSYGQQFLHFNSPEWFLEKNLQKETNLHNLGGTEVSHTLKTGGYIVASLVGIVAPLTARAVLLLREGWFGVFIPTIWMIVPSLFHLLANLPKQLIRLFPGGDAVTAHRYFTDSGEYEEYMFALWFVLYLVSASRAATGQRNVEDG